jgi:hypothetical protein
VLAKPDQRLANTIQIDVFAEDHLNRSSHALIGIFLGLAMGAPTETHWTIYFQLAPTRLLTSRLPEIAALAESVHTRTGEMKNLIETNEGNRVSKELHEILVSLLNPVAVTERAFEVQGKETRRSLRPVHTGRSAGKGFRKPPWQGAGDDVPTSLFHLRRFALAADCTIHWHKVQGGAHWLVLK